MSLLNRAAYSLLVISIAFNPAIARRAPANQGQPAQEKKEQATRLKSDLIEVRAVITDRKGQPVGGLKQEDFELFEDGRPQQISFFSNEKIDQAATARPSDPTSTRQARPSAPTPVSSEPPRRTVALFVDTLHLSPHSLARVKQALKQFVDYQMADQDMVAVITSTASLGLLEQFTRDRQMLRHAVDRLTVWGDSGRESLLKPYLAARVVRDDGEAFSLAAAIISKEEVPDPTASYVLSRCKEILAYEAYRRRLTINTIKAVAERMAALPGQRLMALFSDGFSTVDVGGMLEPKDVEPAISSAVRAGVIIYTLHAVGLKPGMLFDSSVAGFGGSSTLMRIFSSFEVEIKRDSQLGLRDLADGTGGDASFNTDDFGARLKKALDENRIYYVLAYYPPSYEDSNRFRRISVRLKNRPGYTVRAQRGYLPPEHSEDEEARTPQQKMMRAMSATLPLTALGVTALADFIVLEQDQSQALLQLFIDGENLDYGEQGQRHSLRLELAGVAFDSAGKPGEQFSDKIEASLTADRVRQAKQNGYRYTRRLSLKPGMHQVRVVVREPSTERIGTATAWVNVPDLGKNRMALSNILLSERPAARDTKQPQAKEGEFFQPRSKQGIRTYKSGDFLVYYLVLYNAGRAALEASTLAIQVEIFQSGQPVYQSAWGPLTSRLIEKGKKGMGLSGQLQLRLKAGVYELRVTVKGPKQTEQQSVLFAVEA